MNKKEAKQATNEELLAAICNAHVGQTLTKKSVATVRNVLSEMVARGIIEEGNAEKMSLKFETIGML